MGSPSLRRVVSVTIAACLAAGAAAGLVDAIAVLWRVPTALPTGKFAFVAMLVFLYAGTAALGGAALALVAWVFDRATDLGRLLRGAFGDAPAGTVRPAWAYVVAALPLVVAHYAATDAFCRDALTRYHHRGLIASLSSTVSAGFLLVALVLLPLLAALVALARPSSRRPMTQPAPALFVGGVGLALGALALVALALYLLTLQGKTRVPVPLRAVAFARVATGAFAFVVVATLVAARRLGTRFTGPRWRSPAVFASVLVAGIVVVAGGAAAYGWATVKQLDFRPFGPAAVLLMTLVALALSKLPRLEPKPALTAVLAAGALAALALGLRHGENALLRRVGIEHAGLMPFIARAAQAVSDRDRDGYAALLGGGDCDDGNPAIHPGAFDWPDDGVDQDCNGHQATLKSERTRRWATLPASVPKDLNVLLITIDALRADHLGAYGYKRATSPILDTLGKESFLFTNAWSHAPSTRYSIPAIITGRYPSTIAVDNDPRVHWPPKVLPENRLVAEILKDLGYQTGATLSYHYFERGWGLDQGFDEYDHSLERLHTIGGDPAKTHGSSARELTDKNLAFLDTHAASKFFLWTHYYDTHFLFEPHPDAPETNFGKSEIDLYDGEIRYTDLQLGRLFDKLRALGLWDKTIIVITADHGDGFGEHGIPPNKRHGYHLYRNETKVPLFIRVPGIAPRAVPTMATHVDILPTVLNLLGQPKDAEPQLFGDSLVDFMLGQDDPSRRIFQEVWYEGPTSKKAVVDRTYHYIRNLVPEDTAELYDEVADPDEDHDLSGTLPVERDLAAALAAWMDEIAIPANFRKAVDGAIQTTPITPQTALGDALGDWLVLDGADVPATAKAGDSVEVDLIWHVKRPPPSGWRIFMHFVGAHNDRLNADHQPIENLLPLQEARPETWLRDRVRVTVPANWPAGKLHVIVGLWKPNERAPATGAHVSDRAIAVGDIEVVR